MSEWEIRGSELINCNCSYGCPCQFNALPTHGHCCAIGAIGIEQGRHGDTRLDGLACAMAIRWPGPIHEGGGECQPIVDVRADQRQREALLRIMSGLDTDPFATFFAVFATTFATVHEPLFLPIEYQVDVEARRGTIRVPDVLEVRGTPIRNPVTGDEHRARIELPNGFEYEVAEVGSGRAWSRGAVALELEDSYAQFAHLHIGSHGVIRHRAAA